MSTPYLTPPVFSWPAAPGGKLHTYQSGGVTPQATYSDAAGVTPNTNPVTLDSLGSAVVRLAVGVAYHVVLKDATDTTTLWDADNIDNNYLSTASTVGAVLYPRTTAEIAAGITPTDTTYPFGESRRYGILNDGTTDVTAACNTLGAAVWPSETVFTFPAGQYKITDTVTFTGSNIHIRMEPGAQFVYSGAATKAAVVRDYGTAATYRFERYNITTAVSHPFTNFAFIGVQFKGSLTSSHIYLDYALGFTVNWQFAGTSTSGVAYNDFVIGACWDTAYGLNIHSSVASGFVNENNWYGGQFQISSAFNAANPTVACYGVVFDAAGGAYTGSNNNHFWKPCFQLGPTGTTQREPIWMKNAGSYNYFHGIRAEGLYGAVMHVDSDTVGAVNNILEVGYIGPGAGTISAFISETDGGFSNGNRCTMIPGINPTVQYHSGDLLANAWAPSSGNFAVLGHFVQAAASGTEAASGLGEIGKEFIVINSSALGVYVDTSFYKEFDVRADFLASRTGRVAIVAYDATGTQISSTRAVYGTPASQNAQYGGASYTEGSDVSGEVTFRVDSTVKTIKILFASGTNPACLRGYAITAYTTQVQSGPAFTIAGNLNYGLNVWGGPFAPVQKINTTAPNGILGEGYTPRGDIRWNGNAVAGNTVPAGHICTAAGWNARAWVAATAYQLNMLRTNDTAPVKTYVCRQAGTSAGAGGPTGTGTGIVDNTCTWDYVGVPVTTAATWTALANIP